MYDGASALGEAVLMAVRANRKCKSKRILMPLTVHPIYRKVVHTLVKNQGIELIDVPYIKETGKTDFAALQALASEGAAAVVIPQPNFFGVIDNVDVISDWAADNKILSIAAVNPMALAILKPPGEWGKNGVDITCGEGQPMGIPMSSGGPFYGFLCTRKAYVRQMPGRIIGRTVDLDGKDGYALTLQAREQHIRRSKATSNICTNQGLMVTASTIYMAMMGSEGLERTALASHENTQKLVAKLSAIAGVDILFSSAYFHEVVIKLNTAVEPVLSALAEQNILGGYDLTEAYPELGHTLLVCATEMRSDAEIDTYAQCLNSIMTAN
jgi:glycine dehydrogenase subunit 1